MVTDLWTLDALAELAETEWRVQTGELEDVRAAYDAMFAQVEAAIDQASGPIDLPKWATLPPPHLARTSLAWIYSLAAVLVSGTRRGGQLGVEDSYYVCGADRPVCRPTGLTARLMPAHAERDAVLPELRLDRDAYELAAAFYNDMLQRAAAETRPPLLGHFIMTRTGLDAIDDLGHDQIRLVIQPGGIWTGLLFPDGMFCPAWWSPAWDNLNMFFGQRYAWRFRIFLVCLWHDAKAVRTAIHRVRADRKRQLVPASWTRVEGKVIRLPRQIKQVRPGARLGRGSRSPAACGPRALPPAPRWLAGVPGRRRSRREAWVSRAARWLHVRPALRHWRRGSQS